MNYSDIVRLSDFVPKYIEYILLLLGIGLLIIAYSFKYFSCIFMLFSIVIAVIFFILLSSPKFKISDNPLTLSLPVNRRNTYVQITSIGFFICYSVSIFSLLNGLFTKTAWYYVFVSLCAGIIAIEIPLVETELYAIFNIFKSFLLVLNITLSNQIIFPGGISLPDLGLHLNDYILPIIRSGYIPHIGLYEYFPIHHILSAIASLTLGSDPKLSYLYLGGFSISMGIFFIYLIGKTFFNTKFGLFAGLFYTCLDYFIMYGLHPEHQAYNYAFSIVLFGLIFYFYKSFDKRFLLFCIIAIATMVFAHHFSAMILLVVIATFLVVEVLHHAIIKSYKLRFWPIIQVYGLVLLIQWAYYSNTFNSFVGILKAYTDAFANISTSLMPSTGYDKMPLFILFANTLGSCILLFLTIIGLIVYFKKKTVFILFIGALTFILIALLGIGISFKQVALLPDRLYPFLQVFSLVFLAVGGIIYFWERLKSDKSKIILIFSIVLCFAFFSLSSTIAGFETGLFVDESASYYKLFSTQQEEFSIHWNEVYLPNNSEFLSELPITEKGVLNQENISNNSYLQFNKLYLRTGYVHQIGGHLGQYLFIKWKENEPNKLEFFDKYYNNGIILNYYSNQVA